MSLSCVINPIKKDILEDLKRESVGNMSDLNTLEELKIPKLTLLMTLIGHNTPNLNNIPITDQYYLILPGM